jgi:hypothetical protein
VIRADPSIAERLGLSEEAVSILERHGLLPKLDLDQAEIRERLWQGHLGFLMELAGLEPATSWVRLRSELLAMADFLVVEPGRWRVESRRELEGYGGEQEGRPPRLHLLLARSVRKSGKKCTAGT